MFLLTYDAARRKDTEGQTLSKDDQKKGHPTSGGRLGKRNGFVPNSQTISIWLRISKRILAIFRCCGSFVRVANHVVYNKYGKTRRESKGNDHLNPN